MFFRSRPDVPRTRTRARSTGSPVSALVTVPCTVAGFSSADVAAVCAQPSAHAAATATRLPSGMGIPGDRDLHVLGNAVAFFDFNFFTFGKRFGDQVSASVRSGSERIEGEQAIL